MERIGDMLERETVPSPSPGVIGDMTVPGPRCQSGHTYCIAARTLPMSGEHAGDCPNSLYVTQLLCDLYVFVMVLSCLT